MSVSAKPPPPSRFATALLCVSFVFIASGALNYGPFGYFWAAPFALYATVYASYASHYFQSRWPLIGVVVFIASGVLFKETIEKNPLVFPILTDGYLQEVRQAAGARGSDSAELIGERLRVTGVSVSHADLGTNVQLIASDGRRYGFDRRDQLYYAYYQSGTEAMRSEFGFRPSGPVESPVFKAAGDLMWYPMLPFVAYHAVKDALSRSRP
jgi:hypothetical protein